MAQGTDATSPVPLPSDVRAWQARGRCTTLTGIETFHLEAGPTDAPVTVILHGFPTSSYDWHRTLPRLADGRRVVLFDFPGYGLSAKPERYSYSLMEQADVVEALLLVLGIETVQLVAHDMGTSVATELVARRERGLLGFGIRSLLLMNGSVHIEMAHLTPSQYLLRSPLAGLFTRVASKRIFRLQLSRLLGRPLPAEEYEAMWAQLRYRNGLRRLPRIISYLDERRRFRDRWIGALTRLDIPTRVVWGPEDPVAVVAIAERLASEIPGARLERLEGLGHYPQLEDPEATASAIGRFLRDTEPRSRRVLR